MEGQVVLDWRRGLDRLDLQGGTDVGQRAGAEGQRLGMVCLPSLILGTKVEGAGVLEIRGQNDRFIPSLSRELDTQVPGVEGHEGELEVLAEKVFLGEGVKAVDGIPEGSC